MATMLYIKETLEPHLFVAQDIDENDKNKNFYVINGAWDGIFNQGKVTVENSTLGDYELDYDYKCYIFEKDDIDGMEYNDVFVYFRDLIENGGLNSVE